MKGSQNLAGMADPVIDALIERIIAAKDRPSLVNACKALDRVIRAGRYWIPHWYKPSHWVAYWDTFGRPPAKPQFARGIPETWWYDRDKAAKLERAGRRHWHAIFAIYGPSIPAAPPSGSARLGSDPGSVGSSRERCSADAEHIPTKGEAGRCKHMRQDKEAGV